MPVGLRSLKIALTLKWKIIGQFAVILAPLTLLLAFQALSDARRASSLSVEFPLHMEANAARREYKVFVDGVTDAVDSGKLSEPAVRALESVAAHVGRLRELDPQVDLSAVQEPLDSVRKGIARSTALEALLPLRAPITALTSGVTQLDERYERATSDTIAEALASARSQLLVVATATATMLAVAGVFIFTMIRRLTSPLTRAIAVAHAIAKGDLTTRIEVRGQDETAELLRALDTMQSGLGAIVREVRHGTDSISASLAEIRNVSQSIAHRSNALASSMNATVGALDTVSVTIESNVAAADDVGARIERSSTMARSGQDVVGNVARTMGDIDRSGREVAEIVGLINGIAFQTNILALNAAIEAARAGAAGKGFAVVATEVRSLAQRSAEAAAQIGEIIGATVRNVDAGSQQTTQAAERMRDIVAAVEETERLMESIRAGSEEQSAAVKNVHHSVADLGESSRHNVELTARAVDATARAGSEVDRLEAAVSRFRL